MYIRVSDPHFFCGSGSKNLCWSGSGQGKNIRIRADPDPKPWCTYFSQNLRVFQCWLKPRLQRIILALAPTPLPTKKGLGLCNPVTTIAHRLFPIPPQTYMFIPCSLLFMSNTTDYIGKCMDTCIVKKNLILRVCLAKWLLVPYSWELWILWMLPPGGSLKRSFNLK